MVGLKKVSIVKVKFLTKLVEQGLHKTEIKERFMKKFSCHHSTFYDWYDFVYFGRCSGRVSNHKAKQQQYINNRTYINQDKDKCYFCSQMENLVEAHLIYIPKELIVILFIGCHAKYDSLQRVIEQRKNYEMPLKSPQIIATNKKVNGD